jgi:hypothetical protein
MKRALVIVLAGAVLTVVSGAGAATSQPVSAKRTFNEVTFRRTMDRLWEEHVAWTRMAIVGFAAGAPNLKATEARLLRNQVDIGNTIKPFYGNAAGARLTSLLRTHILQAVTVLQAAKAGNQAQLAGASKAWYRNAHQIAAFLSRANPHNWPLAATTMMMNDHLNLTTKEAVDELNGRWAASVRDYDRVETEILGMSDTLAQGIIAQFPNRFAV